MRALCRCRNRSKDLICGRWWWWWLHLQSFRKSKKSYSAKSGEHGGSKRFWHILTQYSFYSSFSRQNTKLAAIWHTYRLSLKMLWTEWNKTSNMLANSSTVILLFFRTKSITHHTQLRSYQFLRPLKIMCSSHCLLSKNYFHIKKISVPFFPILKQNLIQTQCHCLSMPK